jgi:predicted nucleotidyltransferase
MVQKRNNIRYEVILTLLKGNSHLREIARKVKESHSTVLRKLNVLVEENVLDYKTEGKNKVFHIRKNIQAKNYVFNAERYKLIKLLEKYPKLSVIFEDILEKADEGPIVLFGSYAKFMAKKDSDIDIYIETESGEVKRGVEAVYSKIKVKIGKFNLDSNLIKEIIKEHVILKGVEEFYEKTEFFD